MNVKNFILEKSDTQKSNTQKSNTQKRSKKSAIFIALMFFGLMSPKAWGYAEKDLPPSLSEKLFSSGETFSSDQTFFLSRGVLIDEKGVAISQVNLVENPEFLPQFAEPGSSNALKPLDLPECEEELDIVAQYADQAWIKKDVAVVAALLFHAGACGLGFFTNWLEYEMGLVAILTGLYGGALAATSLEVTIGGFTLSRLGTFIVGAGTSVFSGLICYGIANGIRMIYE